MVSYGGAVYLTFKGCGIEIKRVRTGAQANWSHHWPICMLYNSTVYNTCKNTQAERERWLAVALINEPRCYTSCLSNICTIYLAQWARYIKQIVVYT